MSPIQTLHTFELPEHLTPEQALAVLRLLETLTEALWAHYGNDLATLMAEQHGLDDINQPDLFDFDDSLPF